MPTEIPDGRTPCPIPYRKRWCEFPSAEPAPPAPEVQSRRPNPIAGRLMLLAAVAGLCAPDVTPRP